MTFIYRVLINTIVGQFERIKRSTISDADNRVPCQVYEHLFYAMLSKCEVLTGNHKFKFKNPLYALDSTTIKLCLSVFDWAKFRCKKVT